MSVGKYSPTVAAARAANQEWWHENGGGLVHGIHPDQDNDHDGYDSYGYSGRLGDSPDRAGYTEMDYLTSTEYDEHGSLSGGLYLDVYEHGWRFDGRRPVNS